MHKTNFPKIVNGCISGFVYLIFPVMAYIFFVLFEITLLINMMLNDSINVAVIYFFTVYLICIIIKISNIKPFPKYHVTVARILFIATIIINILKLNCVAIK